LLNSRQAGLVEALLRYRFSAKLMAPLLRKEVSSAPKLGNRTPLAFVIDSFLVRTPNYAIGHRD
jgi:hypothetical protein